MLHGQKYVGIPVQLTVFLGLLIADETNLTATTYNKNLEEYGFKLGSQGTSRDAWWSMKRFR